jgi:hypothetical protein
MVGIGPGSWRGREIRAGALAFEEEEMSNVIKTAAAVAVVAGAAMSATASVKNFGALAPEALGSRPMLRGTPNIGIGFEASEGFVLGNIAGQNGWLDNSVVGAVRGTMQVQNGVNSGNGSPNALRLSQGPQAQNQFGIAQAPDSPGSDRITVDTRIDDNGGGNYFVRGLFLAPAGAGLSFRVEFDYRGTIFVQNPVSGTFEDTMDAWVPNQYNNLDVRIIDNDLTTSIQYFYGGNLIHTSTGAPAGLVIDLVQFGHDNFQGIGLGSFSGGGNPAAGYFDNLNAIPTPGALALLGLGGLITGRRRRA